MIEIKLVSGQQVQNKFQTDLHASWHHYNSSFVPENEVWLNDDYDRSRLISILLGTLINRTLMKHYNVPYDKAYEVGMEYENMYRQTKHLEDTVMEFLKLYFHNITYYNEIIIPIKRFKQTMGIMEMIENIHRNDLENIKEDFNRMVRERCVMVLKVKKKSINNGMIEDKKINTNAMLSRIARFNQV